MTITPTVTGGVWSASNGRGNISSTGVVFGISAGLDTFIYSVTNGCGTATATRVVMINPLPDAGTISGPSAVCAGSSISLSATATGGTWTMTNGNATIAASGSVAALTAGLDTALYTVTNACGTAVASRVITINPVPSAGTLTGPSGVCTGATISFTASVGGGVWTSVTGHAAVSSTGGVFGLTGGVDTIIYTVTNVCGTATAIAIVTVTAWPTPGYISGPSSVCEGASVTLTESVSGGTWSTVNARASVSATSGVVTGIITGIDTIVYTVTNACGTVYATTTIT
ncbi:MAG: hypothetical protein EBZ77_16000, partial [Chitinophagia bacterium]|nr:hypothetical protein [Chitinophagia bacterium]